MQVILLEKVVNLGSLGNVVRVKDGYARNFLIPQRMARRATSSAVSEFEAKRAELEKAAAEKLANAQKQGEKQNLGPAEDYRLKRPPDFHNSGDYRRAKNCLLRPRSTKQIWCEQPDSQNRSERAREVWVAGCQKKWAALPIYRCS